MFLSSQTSLPVLPFNTDEAASSLQQRLTFLILHHISVQWWFILGSPLLPQDASTHVHRGNANPDRNNVAVIIVIRNRIYFEVMFGIS